MLLLFSGKVSLDHSFNINLSTDCLTNNYNKNDNLNSSKISKPRNQFLFKSGFLEESNTELTDDIIFHIVSPLLI